LLVTAKMDGHAAVFAVDSGTPVHLLSLPLARAASLTMGLTPTEFTDAMGRPHEGFPVTTTGVVDGIGVPVEKLIASEWADLHDGGAASGSRIDGLLSPQKLAMPGEAIVLDLPRRKIGAMRWADAERAVGAHPQALVDTHLAADGHFYANVTVDGIPRAMIIDTGAPRSMLYAPRGNDTPSIATRQVVRRVRIVLGDVAHALDIDETEALEGTGAAGLLGLDVLGACTLAISSDRLLARCDRASDPRAVVVDVRNHGARICAAEDVCFRTRADGSYVAGDAHIFPNGRLESWSGSQADLQKFYDRTRDLRHAIDHDYYLRESFDGLPRLLDSVWNDRRLAPQARREIVFEIWDECAEPDDPELAHEGAKARRIIAGYVRAKRDRYSAAELDGFRRRRARAPYFEPYRPDVDDVQ
jgi:hypothetical protein